MGVRERGEHSATCPAVLCPTSGCDTFDPFISLAGDTGEVGAWATCGLCGARLRLVAAQLAGESLEAATRRAAIPIMPTHPARGGAR